MQPKTVYIIGKVTGLWYWYAWIKFKVYELYLVGMGFDPINPCMIVPKNSTHDEAMWLLTPHLLRADYVYLQFDWSWKSKGSLQEVKTALRRGKKILNQPKKILEIINKSKRK